MMKKLLTLACVTATLTAFTALFGGCSAAKDSSPASDESPRMNNPTIERNLSPDAQAEIRDMLERLPDSENPPRPQPRRGRRPHKPPHAVPYSPETPDGTDRSAGGPVQNRQKNGSDADGGKKGPSHRLYGAR